MSARQILAMLKSHVEGDVQQFYSAALQAAADEARQGHARVAKELRDLIDAGRSRELTMSLSPTTPLAQPRGDLATMLVADYPSERLPSMTLKQETRAHLERILLEQSRSEHLQLHGLHPRRKLLLVGPPGSGKTMTASAIAGELKLPLFTIRLEGVVTKFLGETAQKLSALFDAMNRTKGVYLFDEFDALGAKRTSSNDIGEIRRVLNSFLQMLERDRSQSVVICATNHPELLDHALFRRFDDVVSYTLPDQDDIKRIMRSCLARFDTASVDWEAAAATARGLSQAEVVRASHEAAKSAVLDDRLHVSTDMIVHAVKERAAAPR